MIPTNPTIRARLVKAVLEKLDLIDGVCLRSWQENADGSHTPVFGVPPTHVASAHQFGLTIEEDK